MFEFDPDKSVANKAKHGIDFDEAQALWLDDWRFAVRSAGSHEERWLVIGMIADRHWTAIYTMRNTAIRIISVRRSRANEVSDYDNR